MAAREPARSSSERTGRCRLLQCEGARLGALLVLQRGPQPVGPGRPAAEGARALQPALSASAAAGGQEVRAGSAGGARIECRTQRRDRRLHAKCA